MRKRHSEEGEQSNERWLLTYADMITLLMAFFIMMYSMSVLNLSKFREAAFSIRSGFGGTVNGQGKSILGTSGTFAVKPSAIQGDVSGASWTVMKPLVSYIEKDADNRGQTDVRIDKRGIVITMLSDKLLFSPGSADVREAAYPLLDKVAETLDKLENRIQVEGHTCDLPPRGGNYRSNWELSCARATNVMRYLTEAKGLNSSRFSVAGYGPGRPIAQNTSDANRKKNRRVEIIIMKPDPEPAPKVKIEEDNTSKWEIRSRD